MMQPPGMLGRRRLVQGPGGDAIAMRRRAWAFGDAFQSRQAACAGDGGWRCRCKRECLHSRRLRARLSRIAHLAVHISLPKRNRAVPMLPSGATGEPGRSRMARCWHGGLLARRMEEGSLPFVSRPRSALRQLVPLKQFPFCPGELVRRRSGGSDVVLI